MSRFFQLSFVFLWTVSLLLLPISPAQAATTNYSVTITANSDPDVLNGTKTPQDQNCNNPDLAILNGDFILKRQSACNSTNVSIGNGTLKPLGDGGNEKTTWDFGFQDISCLISDLTAIESATVTLKGLKHSDSATEETPLTIYTGTEDFFIHDLDSHKPTAPDDINYDAAYDESIMTEEGDAAIQFDLSVPYDLETLMTKIRNNQKLSFEYNDDALIIFAQLDIIFKSN